MVYTSGTLSLALLELLVHASEEDVPGDLASRPAEIPDTLPVERIAATALPRGWRGMPAPPALAAIGEAWVRRAETAVLAVPSAIVPEETNYLLNPRHPGFRRLRIGPVSPFVVDVRLKDRRS